MSLPQPWDVGAIVISVSILQMRKPRLVGFEKYAPGGAGDAGLDLAYEALGLDSNQPSWDLCSEPCKDREELFSIPKGI